MRKLATSWLTVSGLLCLSATCPAWAARSTTHPAVVHVADFEAAVPDGTQVGNFRVEVVTDEGAAASGTGCLRVQRPEAGEDAYVIFPLAGTVSLSDHGKLAAWIRAAQKGRTIRLRWLALDADNWVIFQRLFEYSPGTDWEKLEWPTPQWRWGNERAGQWSDVRALALRLESDPADFFLDDISFVNESRSDAFREAFFRKAAFPDRKSLMVIEDGLLTGTDATKDLSADDLRAMAAQAGQVRSWVRRVFGRSAHPIYEGPPMALLVFARQADYQSFFDRLGAHWNVQVAAPHTGGYTVQDIAACVRQPSSSGAGGPVVLHETTHAVVARELRLLPGSPAHAWLQEGLANYLQLCVYPESLESGTYARQFNVPIDRDSFFRPLKELLGKPVRPCHYAQLASLVAFLAEQKPDWLRQIATGLAQGKELEDVLRAANTDLAELERLWLEWGKQTFVDPDTARDPARPFPLPQEWTQRGAAKPAR